MALETITGGLEVYKQLQKGTMCCVDTLMDDRRDNLKLRNEWIYPADGVVYFLAGKSKTPTLGITREAGNPILQNVDDAIEQLETTGNYFVSAADLESVLRAVDTVLIDLTKLGLAGDNPEWGHLPIGTAPAKYGKLNGTKRELAERAGFTKENVKMLRSAKIREPRIYLLKPEYVTEHASEGAIARACLLYNFLNNSDFNATRRGKIWRQQQFGMSDLHDRIRGERKK
ncbi:MAG: hypothetical protein AABX05_05985 [Nanoarchaeota archaeon]|mgnify:CR=1 FL=1